MTYFPSSKVNFFFFLFKVATELEARWYIHGGGRRGGEKTIFPHLGVDGLLQMVSYGWNILFIGKFLGLRAAEPHLPGSHCSGISSLADSQNWLPRGRCCIYWQ